MHPYAALEWGIAGGAVGVSLRPLASRRLAADRAVSSPRLTRCRPAVRTAAYCAALAARFGGGWTLAPYLSLGLLAATLGDIDRATLRLPNAWLGALAAGTATGMATALAAGHTPAPAEQSVIGALTAGTLLGAGYLALALARPGAIGLGDAKLATVLGGCLGWLGPARLADGTAAGLVLAALAAARLLRRNARTADTRTADTRLALGPHLLAGAVAALVLPASACR